MAVDIFGASPPSFSPFSQCDRLASVDNDLLPLLARNQHLLEFDLRRPAKLVRANSLPRNFSRQKAAAPMLAIEAPIHQLAIGDRKQERRKRRLCVTFADQKGMQLTSVRVMEEPSDVPPQLDLPRIRQLLGMNPSEDDAEDCGWKLGFSQPAADYPTFWGKLQTQNVALENVVIKPASWHLVGSVKVKNLAFEKEIRVRWTADGWGSQSDALAEFVPGSTLDGYECFSFALPLPRQAEQLQFCVCYSVKGADFWDNNGGSNFLAFNQPRRPRARKVSPPDLRYPVYSDPAELNHGRNWADFSSWNDLVTSGPYY